MVHEITGPQRLLDGKGQIARPGWARRPYWNYQRTDIRAGKWRIKEWDYYIVIHDGRADNSRSFAAAFTLSDDGYVGLQSVSLLFLDEAGKGEHTRTVLTPLPMGRMKMPHTSMEGDISYRDRLLSMDFKKTKGHRGISCRFESFYEGACLTADISLTEPRADSMTIATPFEKQGRFYYNQKIGCMPASGRITLGKETWFFDPAKDFATLDWGRGVWTYDNTWYWGNGNGLIDGKPFGFNIGYGFGDCRAASENILFFDGKAHKLQDVDFGIPGDVSKKDMKSPAYMDPWQMRSGDGRFTMTFNPILDRAAKLNFGLIVSDQHQVFGRLNGEAVLDDGQVIRVRDLLCFAEKVHNRF